jgi:hypothetical protein
MLTPRDEDPAIEDAVFAKLDRMYLILAEDGTATNRENTMCDWAAGCADGFTVGIESI